MSSIQSNDNSDCHAAVTVYSRIPDRYFPRYTTEFYQLPCIDASKFLRKLGGPTDLADKDPRHKVTYAVVQKERAYVGCEETTWQAAAKIELFMKNPDFLPKRPGN